MIYLYLKTHKKTGLKYLGKTTQNPFKYYGSGKYWLKHLGIHGLDIETVILKECETEEELKEHGLYYSELWDVVNNKEFANLIKEEGTGGSGENNPMHGRSAVAENNLKWYTNKVDNLYIPEGSQPIGYDRGRTITYKRPHSQETRDKIGNAHRGRSLSETHRMKLRGERKPHTQETRDKIGNAHRGRSLSEAHKMKLRRKRTKEQIQNIKNSRKPSYKKCVSPDGVIFESLTAAAISEGISRRAITERIRRGVSGWRYYNP